MKTTVYLVDDDTEILKLVGKYLRSEGFAVETFSDGRFVVDRCRIQLPSVVVLDIVMEEMGGLETMKRLREMAPELPIIAVSGGGAYGTGADYTQKALQHGANATLDKPFDLSDLSRIIAREVDNGISV